MNIDEHSTADERIKSYLANQDIFKARTLASLVDYLNHCAAWDITLDPGEEE